MCTQPTHTTYKSHTYINFIKETYFIKPMLFTVRETTTVLSEHLCWWTLWQFGNVTVQICLLHNSSSETHAWGTPEFIEHLPWLPISNLSLRSILHSHEHSTCTSLRYLPQIPVSHKEYFTQQYKEQFVQVPGHWNSYSRNPFLEYSLDGDRLYIAHL